MGLSSTLKAYNSFAPFITGRDGKVVPNEGNSLTKSFHLLTLDFPCGQGLILNNQQVAIR